MRAKAARSFAALLLGCVATPGLALAFPDGAPAGHTGGFGEPDCSVCHFGGESGEAAALTLRGLPKSYVAGRSYTFELYLADPDQAVGGFQLSARFLEGARQGEAAGRLEAVGEGAAILGRGDLHSLGHNEAAALEGEKGHTRWRLLWTAPEDAAAVVFHAAAVTGNDDLSPLDDSVHTLEQAIRPD